MGKPGGGASAIFEPNGVKFSDNLPETVEGLIYANLNLNDVIQARALVHLGGVKLRYQIPTWVTVTKRHAGLTRPS